MQVTLPAIAFGGRADAYPLPAAHTPWDRWFRAVGLGGQGYYAAAATELRRVDVGTADVVLRSLAASTRAAHLRQGGQHSLAVHHDARALAVLGGPGPRSPTYGPREPSAECDPAADDRHQGAYCDALTGLAADNLGRGMFVAAERLLDRVDAVLSEDHHLQTVSDWLWHGRPRLRSAWVRAELAMYTGDPAAAEKYSAAALVSAGSCPSIRHRIKTELIAAAAAASAGEVRTAVERASRVGRDAAAAGQLPLRWASAMLLDALGAGGEGPGVVATLQRELADRGGAMR